ncbi:hypothetical protein [Paenibacillus rigui]|uniref:Uncharacterized protein n=1 Tax=Paenibacillus rigui TaxID=554312 RepID=A0A229UKM4_9BACL|nr:hypothetical protein [Paenibacillus rigui]OXM83960.1 hypothetical protein CF651_22875 [Paenibacillus rigui]
MATIPKSLGQPARPYMIAGYTDQTPAKSSTTPAPYPGMLAPKANGSTSGASIPTASSTAATMPSSNYQDWGATDQFKYFQANPTVGQQEIARATNQANIYKAAGDMAKYNDAQSWLGKVNTVMSGVQIPTAASKASQAYTDALDSYKQQIATPYAYDPAKDQTAQAYKAYYDNLGKEASRNAMEDMNSSGLLNSSMTAGEVAAAQQNANLQYGMKVADLGNQAYQRYQDNLANQGRLIGLLGNQQQFETQNQQWDKTYGLQKQGQEFNQGLATKQESRAQQAQDANYTGYYDNSGDVRRKMAENSAAWYNASPEEQQRLHDENLRLGQSIGAIYNDQTGDYAFSPATRTLQGQAQDLSSAQVMGQLTGKMPDGTPTNAAQQQQLQNLWTVAEQTGKIPDTLADLYGLPRGTQTQVARQQAIQNRFEQQRIGLSAAGQAQSASNAAANLGLNRDKFEFEKQQALGKSGSKQLSQSSYSEFLQDLPRISSADEGYSLIQSYRQDGVDETTLSNMLKAINSKFKE